MNAGAKQLKRLERISGKSLAWAGKLRAIQEKKSRAFLGFARARRLSSLLSGTRARLEAEKSLAKKFNALTGKDFHDINAVIRFIKIRKWAPRMKEKLALEEKEFLQKVIDGEIIIPHLHKGKNPRERFEIIRHAYNYMSNIYLIQEAINELKKLKEKR